VRLTDLRKDILTMSEVERLQFFETYWNRRAKDLLEVVAKVKVSREPGTGKTRDKKIYIKPEQLALLRRLKLV
jgi:hypothetical protein